jgi:hypothetical protein
VIVPGWFNNFGRFAAPFVPKFLLVPFMGLLFRVLDAEGNTQLPRALAAPKTGGVRAKVEASSEDGPR